jgi:hypothetical protein
MVYAFGAYTLDTDRYELRRAGTVCPLEPHAVDILTYFLQQAHFHPYAAFRSIILESMITELDSPMAAVGYGWS